MRLEAGERLSFNQTVGLRTDESGYVQAEEPAYGQDISGIGGGVCQVSTALYRLALLGGLEVAERSAAVYPFPIARRGRRRQSPIRGWIWSLLTIRRRRCS